MRKWLTLTVSLLLVATPLVAQQVVEYQGHLLFRPHDPEVRFVGSLKFEGLSGGGTTDPILAGKALHLRLQTDTDSKVVRINSRDYTGTTGSFIGFQSKPAVTVTKTADGVIGGEISPRVNSGIAMAGASGTVIGLHVDTYMRGTAAGTIGGDLRALQLEQVTDDAATRTISGNVNHIRIRSAWSGTISGTFIPIRVEKAEAQTNSKNYDALLDLTSTSPGVWNDDPATEVSGAIKGYIKVRVNGQTRYLALYDTGPTD